VEEATASAADAMEAPEPWPAPSAIPLGDEAGLEPSPPYSSDQAWLDALDWLPEAGDDEPTAAAETLVSETDTADAPDEAAGSTASDIDAAATMPSWMAWIEEDTDPTSDEAAVVDIAELLEDREDPPEAAQAEPDLQELVKQVVEDEESFPLVSAVAEATSGLAVPESPMPAPFEGVFDEVADRLENIAGSLRRRSSGDAQPSTGATDPLELLLTGFVLGYVARQGGDPRRPPSER
jgi:hypothetical protein